MAPETNQQPTVVTITAGQEESGANIPSTLRSYVDIEARDKYIEDLRAEAGKWKDAHGEACANLVRIHAFATGEAAVTKRGVIEDIEDAITALRERVAELEGKAAPPAAEAVMAIGVYKEFIGEAYECMRGQIEGDLPPWSELSEATQALYRDGALHVLNGGEPRTDFERTVHILSGS